MQKFFTLLFSILLFSCNGQESKSKSKPLTDSKLDKNNLETIVFGGGCFWCVEPAFDMLKGVEKAVSGYAGGTAENANYEEVSTGNTGHAEVVEIYYDPKLISYEQLMEVFYFMHDPTQLNRQGADVGTQYRSVVFYKNAAEKAKAEAALKIWEATGKWNGKYVTQISKLDQFYTAEEYHQGYYDVNPNQPYCSAVIGPKIAKFKKYFGDKGWLKADSK